MLDDASRVVANRVVAKAYSASGHDLHMAIVPSARSRLTGTVHLSHQHIIITEIESHRGLMVSTQVRQSKSPGIKSRSGQISYFHGVKTGPSTLGTTGDIPRGSDSRTVGPVSHNIGGHKRTTGEWRGWNRHCRC